MASKTVKVIEHLLNYQKYVGQTGADDAYSKENVEASRRMHLKYERFGDCDEYGKGGNEAKAVVNILHL